MYLSQLSRFWVHLSRLAPTVVTDVVWWLAPKRSVPSPVCQCSGRGVEWLDRDNHRLKRQLQKPRLASSFKKARELLGIAHGGRRKAKGEEKN